MVERRRVYRDKPWRPELLGVAGVILVIVAAGWVRVGDVAEEARVAANDADVALERVEAFAEDLRDSAVDGCQRQNKVRKRQHEVQDIVRAILKADIEESRHPDPAILDLLGLTPEDVEGVSDAEIERLQKFRRQLNHPLALAPCQETYPRP